MQKYCLIVALALLCQLAIVMARAADDSWVWRSYSRRERGFNERDIDRDSYANKLKREPTTRRPLPGELENDEIEDYDAEPTVASKPVGGTRQHNPYPNINPFGGIGGIGQPPIGGQFGGLGGGNVYGNGNPNIPLGQGGSPSILGGQPYNPSYYQPGISGFGNGLGQGAYPGFYGNSGFGGANYPGVNLGGNYGGYPNGQQGAGLGLGQFPTTGSQYPYTTYPGIGTDFNSNQFGGQYPGLGQYPSNQYNGPFYPGNFGQSGLGLGPSGYGGNFGPAGNFGAGNFGAGSFGYDAKSATPQGKSAKTIASTPATVNDKLSKKV